MEKITSLLEKYDTFKDAQLRSLEQPAEDAITLTIAILDEDFMQDVQHVVLKFSGVKESRLLENAMLPYLDTMFGVNIIHERDMYALAVGQADALIHVHMSPFYIIAKELDVEEITL